MGRLKYDKMGTAPMFSLIVSMSLPSIFSMLIQALYNIVDSIFVSMVSDKALTAVSLAFPVQMFVVAVAIGTGVGINSLMSRQLGGEDVAGANSTAVHGLVLSVISWAVFAVLGIVITKPFFSIYTNDAEIFNMGVSYLSCVTVFSFGCFVEITIEKILQATGNMIQPMIFILIGAITNIILDPFFIFGVGFFPRLGVFGAAVATVVGQILSMIYALFILFAKEHTVKVHFKGFRLNLITIKNIYAVGMPSIAIQCIIPVTLLFMNRIIVNFSAVAVSVFGIYYKLQSFVFMPVLGLTHGVMPIMGYNYGACNKSRLMQALKYGCLIASAIMAAGTVVFWVCPELLLSIFSPTAEMLEIGVPALRIISTCFIPAAIGILFTTLFQAVGRGLRSLFITALRQIIVILPVAYFLSYINLEAVWYSFPISEIVSLIASVLLFVNLLRGDFKKRFDSALN